MLTNTQIERIVEAGAKRWTKGNMDRLYINAEVLGYNFAYYKTGNISYAAYKGNEISHAEGYRVKNAKSYIDIGTGKLHISYRDEDYIEAVNAFVEAIEL